MPAVFIPFVKGVSILIAHAIPNAALAAAVSIAFQSFLINKTLSLASRALFSRPPDAVRPKVPGVLVREIVRARMRLPIVVGGGRFDVFDGLRPWSRTLAVAWGAGSCLEPEYPDCRTIYVYDSALPVRSGDLVLVEHRQRKQTRRSGGMFASSSFGGMLEMETTRLVKYAERRGEEWVLHSNDPEFAMGQSDRFAGRVVAAAVVPKDSAFHKRMLKLDAQARAA